MHSRHAIPIADGPFRSEFTAIVSLKQQLGRLASLFLYPDALAGASPCGENLIVAVLIDGERERVKRL